MKLLQPRTTTDHEYPISSLYEPLAQVSLKALKVLPCTLAPPSSTLPRMWGGGGWLQMTGALIRTKILIYTPIFCYLKYLLWLALFFSMASNDPIPRYFFNLTPSAKKYSPGASDVPANIEPIITESVREVTSKDNWAQGCSTFIELSPFSLFIKLYMLDHAYVLILSIMQ